MIIKTIDGGLRREYSRLVAEKKAAGFGSPIKKADIRHKAVFFRPDHAVPSTGGSGEEASACRLPSFRSSNLAICRPPRLEARSGLTLKKEAPMPGTLTPAFPVDQSPAWTPVLLVFAGLTACGIEVVSKRRLAPQATKEDAADMAREACSHQAEAIGFIVEPALNVAEVDHA